VGKGVIASKIEATLPAEAKKSRMGFLWSTGGYFLAMIFDNSLMVSFAVTAAWAVTVAVVAAWLTV
jgi:hypothetical protein